MSQEPVCLITPPSVFLLDERVFMSLGVLRVAAVLEQRGVPVEVLDLSGVENFEEVASLHARQSGAQLFGVTATTPQMPAAARVAQAIRAARPESSLLLGGPHVTLVNAAVKRENQRGAPGRAARALEELERRFDILIAGDGEDAIFEALRENPPRLIDADDPKSPLFLRPSRLSELAFPARHLIDVESYRYTIEGRRALSLIAQLGCPFGCGFCGGRNAAALRQIRTRSVRSIVHELDHLYSTYGYTAFMFYDDELNVSRSMVELMNAICLRDKACPRFNWMKHHNHISSAVHFNTEDEALGREVIEFIHTLR